MQRRYQAVYNFGVFMETIGWVIGIGGALGGILALTQSETTIGLVLIAIGLILGPVAIVNAQILLVVVDTENNTRLALKQLETTNQMLSDTLGRITAAVLNIAGKE